MRITTTGDSVGLFKYAHTQDVVLFTSKTCGYLIHRDPDASAFENISVGSRGNDFPSWTGSVWYRVNPVDILPSSSSAASLVISKYKYLLVPFFVSSTRGMLDFEAIDAWLYGDGTMPMVTEPYKGYPQDALRELIKDTVSFGKQIT